MMYLTQEPLQNKWVLLAATFGQRGWDMVTSAVAIRRTGVTCASNVMTLITFLVLNLIVIIPIAQIIHRALD